LGELRVRKTRQVLNRTDLAVLVVDSAVGITRHDEELIGLFKERSIDYLIVWNKTDLVGYREDAVSDTGTGQNGLEGKADRDQAKCREIHVSARTGRNIDELREMLTALAVRQEPKRRLVGDIIRPHDFVVLVVPIDDAAPKGRL